MRNGHLRVVKGDDITASNIDSVLRRIDKVVDKNRGSLVINLTLDSGGENINETIRAVNRIRELNNEPMIQIRCRQKTEKWVRTR